MGVAWRHATDRERLDDDFDFEPVNVRVGSSFGSAKISEVFRPAPTWLAYYWVRRAPEAPMCRLAARDVSSTTATTSTTTTASVRVSPSTSVWRYEFEQGYTDRNNRLVTAFNRSAVNPIAADLPAGSGVLPLGGLGYAGVKGNPTHVVLSTA